MKKVVIGILCGIMVSSLVACGVYLQYVIVKKKRAKRLEKKIGKQSKNNETELDSKE